MLSLIVAALMNQARPAPYGPTPTPAQLKCAERGLYAFCHFTVDTFTDKEWGEGDEDPKVFNPTEFDADQIAKALKAGGLKAVILTAKHHDGFCLWPTKATEHNISQSPFQNGKGDMVKEFAQAAHKNGLEFGVYLSPWDRNSALYGKPEYVTDVYRKQMRELLTNYGPICEFWMDGANGGTGYYGGARENRTIDRSTYYGWPTTWAEVERLQPGAVMFSDVGPGVRWCGNESGYVKDPCWATYTPESPESGKTPTPGYVNSDLGMTGTRNGEHWMPAEVDVSIRPGWFWHEKENDKVRSPQNLMQIFLQSVGLGATLILNVPPDRRGRLYETDVAHLKTFGDHLRATFAHNLAEGAHTVASNVRAGSPEFGPNRMLGHGLWDAWITDDDVHTPSVEFHLSGQKTFNLIRLREDIRLGQRVDGVSVDAWVDGAWKEVAKAESIGICRLWRVPKTTTDRVRIRVTSSPVCPALANFGLFEEPDF
jgi:alpha-L-fucosidase